MIYNESSILADIYSNLLNEDLQSSLNQARNTLKNNGVENFDATLKELENIYNRVTFESNEHQSSRSDQDIPALAFLILAGYAPNRISELYTKYCNTKSLYSKNSIAQWGQNIRNIIQSNKWFKPSVEKTKFIQDEATKLVEIVHKNYTPPENKVEDSDYEGDSGDIVFNNGKLLIYRADSMDKCILYGDKNLCISYPKKDNYFWRYRLGKMRHDGQGMTTYFVNWLDNGKKILIDALGNKDGGSDEYSWNPISSNTDSDITKEELIRRFPDLKQPFDEGVFQFIEWGETERRAWEIDENIDSILDERLNGYTDYDTFIQLDKGITDSDWNNLNLDNRTKSILFKKYMGSGGLVSLDNIKKYGDLKDLSWYEDILSRNKGKSIRYYLYANGNISNEKIKSFYNNERIRVDKIGDRIRDEIRKKPNVGASLNGIGLYFLPNLEDLVIIGDFNCSQNRLQSLKGAPKYVGGSFDCSHNQLQSLEGAPQKVGGYFDCSHNQLQSLEGSPKMVESFYCSINQLKSLEGSPKMVRVDFVCRHNQLQSLEGAPQKVGRDFVCRHNQLQSLEGAPQKVGRDFDCSHNQLQSLEGAPQKVGGYFDCSHNQLQSLEGAPKIVGDRFVCDNNQLQSLEGSPKMVESFYCSINQLKSLEGSPKMVRVNFVCSHNQLQSLEGAPQKVGRDFDCSHNQLQSLEGAPQKIGGYFKGPTSHNFQLLKGMPIENDYEIRSWMVEFKNELRKMIASEIDSGDIKESYDFKYLIERAINI